MEVVVVLVLIKDGLGADGHDGQPLLVSLRNKITINAYPYTKDSLSSSSLMQTITFSSVKVVVVFPSLYLLVSLVSCQTKTAASARASSDLAGSTSPGGTEKAVLFEARALIAGD